MFQPLEQNIGHLGFSFPIYNKNRIQTTNQTLHTPAIWTPATLARNGLYTAGPTTESECHPIDPAGTAPASAWGELKSSLLGHLIRTSPLKNVTVKNLVEDFLR